MDEYLNIVTRGLKLEMLIIVHDEIMKVLVICDNHCLY